MTPARGSGLPEREQPPQEVDPMRTPTTALDDRFSDPDAAPTPWATTVRTLADAQLFWITTVRADGRPHVTPLVAVWLDDALHFCTGAAEQKAANLRSRPDVVLTTGATSGTAGSTSSSRDGRSAPPTSRCCVGWRTRGGGSGTASGASRSATAPSTTPTAGRHSSSP